MKKCWLVILSMILLCALLGCSNDGVFNGPAETENTLEIADTTDGQIELWVLTDATLWDGMNTQVKDLVKVFKRENNISINLEILPTDAKRRATRLEQLRVEILAGKGPDIYLMPTSNYLTLDVSGVTGATYLVEPLFTDAEMVMHNGHFADISTYYDADDDLNKEGLITKVMDAGVVDEERYILPLRYNIPILYADTVRLAEFEVDQERLHSGNIMDLMDLAIETENPLLAGGAISVLDQRGLALSAFPDVINYEEGNLNLTQEELESFLVKLQKVKALTKGNMEFNYSVNVNRYVNYGESLSSRRYPIKQALLDDAIEIISVSKAAGDNITMIPLRATDGSLVAHVTYYGAVGSSCDNPEVAYEFLRLFLLEDAQWEHDRPTTKSNNRNLYPHFIEEGWPVRAVGAAEHLEGTCFRGLVEQFKRKESTKAQIMDVVRVKITDDDVYDLLTAQIDEVRFRIPLEWDLRTLISSLSIDGSYPSDIDINEVAEEMIYMLELHIAEG